MKYLLDGYNYVAYVLGHKNASNRQLKDLLLQLGSYADKTRQHIIVLFDGGLLAHKERSKSGYLEIVYAGQGHSADDEMVYELQRYERHEITAVTADRELQARIRQAGYSSINPGHFAGDVSTQQQQSRKKQTRINTKISHKTAQTPVIKYNKQENTEIDKLMQYAAQLKDRAEKDDE